MHVIGIILLPLLLNCEHVASMFHYKEADLQKSYDYIIVGGGSAGCVLANRLSESGNWSVLMLEAGPTPPGISDVPMFVPNLIGSKEDWAYVAEPQENAFLANKNKELYISRYRALGGCSSHNFMLYVRGNKKDFDEWAKQGATGWDWEGVLPYFTKSEDLTDTSIADNGLHGKGGELTVSASRYLTPSGEASIKAATTALGIPPGDYNGETQSVVAALQLTQRDGQRCSTEKAFLRPAAGRENLDIRTNAYVTKINFNNNKRAVSVDFEQNNSSFTARSRKEIILAGGAFGSPHLLLVSGVGPRKHLKDIGIDVVADLPVGENLHDHVATYGAHYFVDDPDSLVFSKVLTPENAGKFIDGEGPLTSPVTCEVTAFATTKHQNKSEDWPDMQLITIASALMPPPAFLRDEYVKEYMPLLDSKVKTVFPIVARPKSRGYLRLRTSNIHDHPIINPRYLSRQEDVDVIVEGLKMVDAWMKAPEMQKFNPRKAMKSPPGCEGLVDETEEFYECLTRQLTGSVFHPVGSCKMGGYGDATAVVDPKLRVRGVKGLRVADGSIMPVIVSANTNAACIMIGEKAADLILKRAR